MLNTLYFRTAGMAAVWLCEVRGQFSDGYYENNEAWMDEEKSRILEGFLGADVEVAGEGWKGGLDMGDGYREGCPLSGVEALESVLSNLNYHEAWPYRVAFYYTFGEKYGIEKLKELQDAWAFEVVEDIAFDAWFLHGMPSYRDSPWYKQHEAKLKECINEEELLDYFENLNKDAIIEKVYENMAELDMVLQYSGHNR